MNLHIEKTNCSPEVFFDTQNNKLSIDGVTFPENATAFFKPILEWIDNFLLNMPFNMELNINLTIPYMNTSSSKCIFKMLKKLQNSYKSGKNIKIFWYYHADDDTELEYIEDIMEDLEIPINTVSIEQ